MSRYFGWTDMFWTDDGGTALTPHGFCLLWEPGLIWLHVASDLATALAYFAIPISLALLARGNVVEAQRGIISLFAGFILACGATHVMSIVTLWEPFYLLEGLIKAGTALLSIGTAVALWPIVPNLLAMPSRAAIETLNAELNRRIVAHQEVNARLQENEARLEAAQRQLAVRFEEKQYSLQVANEQQRVLFENSPDALCVIQVDSDASGPRFVFETVNPVFERMMSQTLDELADRSVTEAGTLGAAGDLLDALTRCVARNDVVTFRMTQRSSDHERELETSLAPVADPRSGVTSRIVGVLRDVTQRSLLERQVLHMQKVEITGRLTAGVAHDFNNILQALMGGLELLADTLHGDERDFAAMALRSAERGAELTHRLLAFCRQQVLEPRAVDLGEILTAVTSLLGGSLTPGVRLHTLLPDAPLAALVDAAQLEAALLNLLVNAGDATGGAGSITLSAARADSPPGLGLPQGDWALVTVTDTGAGMDEAVLRQACEPFFTTKGPKGSGLGLSMVQGFVRQSGGEMHIRSAPGAGTRVELWLPMVTSGATQTADAGTQMHGSSIGSGHVLLVDDTDDVLAAVGAYLTSAGLRVTRSRCGRDALRQIESGSHFDGVITDYAMPGMTGTDLVRAARDVRPDLPVLMITGFGEALFESSSDIRILRKPFSRKTLLQEAEKLVKQALSAHRAA